MRFANLLTFIFLLIHLKGFEQEYNYYHYDINNGLSGITVYTIAQDKDGFLWFGTETGLSRFDGSHFKNFALAEGLNENEIINLFVDSKNRVWIFPFKNSIYYYYNGKIFNETNDSLLKSIHLKNEIFSACEDSSGNIYFLETKSLHILTKNNELKEINSIDGKPFYLDGCGISPNGNFNFFLSFSADIMNFKISMYEYNHSQLIKKKAIDDRNFSRNSVIYNSNYILLRKENFFQVYNRKTNESFNIKIPDHFHTLSNIGDSCFTVSTLKETYLFNVTKKSIVDSFLVNKTVNKCFRDNENNLWFATMSHGVYRLSSTRFKIYTLENGYTPAYSLNRLNNTLYIGSSRMLLWSLNLKKDELKKLKLGLEYNIGKVSVIQSFGNQNLILGTDNGIFKVRNNHILSFWPRISFKSFFLHKDSIIVASDRFVFDIPLNNLNARDTIWNNRATSVCKIKNRYYIGTLGNLYSIKKNINNLRDTSVLLKEKVIALVSAPNNYIWVATGNSGIICMRNDKIVYQITTKTGLPSNSCRCVYLFNKNLWIGTDKGVCKINISSYPFNITHYTAAEGLDCDIINSIYVKNDSVFVGTPFGVTFFSSEKIQSKSICELKILGVNSKNINWYDNQSKIHLSNNDNFLHFEYTAISFISAGDITYYYQLKGLDNSWQSTKQNSVEFESLPSRNYTFNIYAINRYGIKSKTISILFTKEKMFWQLWWVQIILLICFIFLIWLLVRIRIKTIREKANNKILREKKMHELEQMALRAQMNPHFIFNSLNSLQQYVFAGNVLEANQFITAFSSLIRQTLYISEKKFVTLNEEIKYLDTYLHIEQTKYDNNFDYFIYADNTVSKKQIAIPPLLLQPYIENSIRHGILNLLNKRGRIEVNFIIEDDYLKCTLEDNGIGRENAYKLRDSFRVSHQSKGMELVKKRIAGLNHLYNINILVLIEDIRKDNCTGTRVIIKLPLYYDK